MHPCTALSTLALALLPCLALGACGGGGSGGGGAAVLELTVTPRMAAFPLGDPILLDVALENVSGSPVAVSPLWDAVLKVDGFTRNGTNWPGTTSNVLGEAGYAQAQAADLRTLAPGETLEGVLQTEYAGSVPGQTLHFLGAGADDVPTATIYSMKADGAYVLELHYAYTGVVPPGVPVHVGATASTTASFSVTP